MKVLVADDDPVTQRLLALSLGRWNYELALASDGTQALDILLGKDSPQLAILDWVMPGADGVEICRKVRKQQLPSYIYILLLTSKASREDLLEGLQAGADDYLIKPFDLMELQARLWSGQRIITVQNQLMAAREALREQATHDALTGIWNRGAVLDILNREFSRSFREKTPLSVIMADIDHFKRINDTGGHQTGDAVLQEVARRVRIKMRPYDSVGRYGGEEFLMIAPGCDKDDGTKLADRIRSGIAANPIFTPQLSVPVQLSLGVATYSGESSPDELIRRADEALYRAKSLGRNRVETA